MQKMGVMLKECGAALRNIGYMLAPDVDLILDDISQVRSTTKQLIKILFFSMKCSVACTSLLIDSHYCMSTALECYDA